jgi:hypothetical protein
MSTIHILEAGRVCIRQYRVDAKQLVYGIGLLLVDQLEKASVVAKEPRETISSWLEPHAVMDIKAERNLGQSQR